MAAAARKQVLTDRTLKSLRPAPAGRRYIVWDGQQPNFGVRVTDKATGDGKAARVSFVVVRRRPGQRNPDTVVLGTYAEQASEHIPADSSIARKRAMTLAEARRLASQTLNTLAQGKRPTEVEAERNRADAKRRRDTFGAVAELFIERHVARLRSARAVEALIRRELLTHWRDRPIADLTRRDAIELIESIGSPHQARKTFAAASKLFNWALARDAYGLDRSPLDRVKFADLIGLMEPRSRVLTDDELRLVWRAAERLAYPHGTLIQALMLTGQRLNEIAGARWAEIENDALVVPPERMKGKQAHSVPLTPAMIRLMEKVPRFKDGAFIFSASHGHRPVGGFSSKARARLDREIAALRDKDGVAGEIAPFVIHDIRRTVRTRLSSLGVLPLVAELVIAHRQGGVHGIYDRHRFDAEKRAALAAWEGQLMAIVEPRAPDAGGSNVVPPEEMARRRGGRRA